VALLLLLLLLPLSLPLHRLPHSPCRSPQAL
jgi:hypothetical protein